MPDRHDEHARAISRIFGGLSFLGVLIALFGLGFDFVPGASPGFSAPQVMMILGGAVLSIGAYLLRHKEKRDRIRRGLKANLLKAGLVAAVTLLALELILTLLGRPTWFPADVPETFLEPVPWWTCDAAGCHYVYEEMLIACQNGQARGRRCLLNRQGFHDTQDFVASVDHADRLRVLVLGDSFTFGGSADLGMSFVEAIERQYPDAIVWNTAIPGAGTNQALMSFDVYAPILQPQVTILGFYMNDYDDNMMPVDSYFMGVNADERALSIRQYQVDLRGNLLKLDRQSDLYYRYHRVDPPANEFHRLVGTTRLGALGLGAIDAVQQLISKAEGTRLRRRVDVTRQYLAELRNRAEDAGSQLLALVIPRREDLSAPGPLYQHTLLILEELGIAYLAPAELLDAKVDYARHPDVHWSNEGHQIAGALLISCLEIFQTSGDVSDCEL